jgi:hypothetical protein
MNESTQNGAYHERAANGNLCMVVLFKNFRCGLIDVMIGVDLADGWHQTELSTTR